MFVGERTIPNSGDKNIMDRINWFIFKYEPACLKYVLGYDLYYLVRTPYVTGDSIDRLINGATYVDNYGNTAEWVGLRPLLVDYIYYYYMKDDVSANTGKGVAIPAKDMAYNLSPAQKMIEAWNEFTRFTFQCAAYLTANVNAGSYPSYTLSYARDVVYLTAPINEFDI
jgi:hypothetical protein